MHEAIPSTCRRDSRGETGTRLAIGSEEIPPAAPRKGKPTSSRWPSDERWVKGTEGQRGSSVSSDTSRDPKGSRESTSEGDPEGRGARGPLPLTARGSGFYTRAGV